MTEETQNQREDREFGAKRRDLEKDHIRSLKMGGGVPTKSLVTVGVGLLYACMTAGVLILMVFLLSRDSQAENTRHREANRCQAALIVAMLRDAYAVNPAYESIANRYPDVNTEGIDCTPYLTVPIDPDLP